MGQTSGSNPILTVGDQREGISSPSTSLWGPSLQAPKGRLLSGALQLYVVSAALCLPAFLTGVGGIPAVPSPVALHHPRGIPTRCSHLRKLSLGLNSPPMIPSDGATCFLPGP